MVALILAGLMLIVPRGIDGSLWDEPVQASAVAVRENHHPENVEASTLWSIPEWARCPNYWPAAQQAGWKLSDMPKIDYITHRESRCNPNARNKSGAAGPVQWMPMWFNGHNNYGWVFNPYDPYQALYHMRLRVADAGWHDWCLRNDPVTGSC